MKRIGKKITFMERVKENPRGSRKEEIVQAAPVSIEPHSHWCFTLGVVRVTVGVCLSLPRKTGA